VAARNEEGDSTAGFAYVAQVIADADREPRGLVVPKVLARTDHVAVPPAVVRTRILIRVRVYELAAHHVDVRAEERDDRRKGLGWREQVEERLVQVEEPAVLDSPLREGRSGWGP
jgi:hypothetical protein